MKKVLLISLIIAVIAAGSFLWLRNPRLNQPDQPSLPAFVPEESGGAHADTEPGTTLESDVTEQEEMATGRGFAKTITHVPDNSASDFQSERPFDFGIQESVKQMVDSALTGDVEVSIELGQLVSRCVAKLQSEAQILQSLQMRQDVSPKTYFSFPNGEGRRFQNFEEYEAYIWNTYDQCRVIRTIFQDDLRERVTQMADDGHVIARYIYAMWRPITVPDPDIENMLEWTEYQEKAFQYSLRNMDEGEPLGFLAFAQSYRNINPGFFTPPHHQMAPALFIASKKCGLKSPWLDAQINEYRERKLKGDPSGGGLQEVELQAEEFKALFCN